jgi:hypothetical protein
MARYARLNDPDPRVRARLQAALYANREKRVVRELSQKIIDGVVYERIKFQDAYLDDLLSSQKLYMRAP